MRCAPVVLALGLVGACRQEPRSAPTGTDADPAVAGAVDNHLRVVRVPDLGGTAYFAPDQRSFWAQSFARGDALVHVDLDGKELGRVPLRGDLGGVALWIRTSTARRPMSPDGASVLEDRSEDAGAVAHGHTAFVVDLAARTEVPLPVDPYTAVDWLADGRLLAERAHHDAPPQVDIVELGTARRTPICAQVAGLFHVRPSADGRSLVVTTRSEVFAADLACTKRRTVVAEPRAYLLDSPHGTGWLAVTGATGAEELRIVEPSPRTVGSLSSRSAVWLDDDRFVYLATGVAMTARVASPAAAVPVLPATPGCHDISLSAAPAGGVVTFAHVCGEGAGEQIVVTVAPHGQ